VETKMGRAENKGVKLSAVGVDDLLKKGFGGKGWEYEQRATDVQLGFERWVLTSDQVCSSVLWKEERISLTWQNAALARKAFSSYVRAYSTHPAEEKQFFHPKSLHLGHLAKAFALREAPSALSASTASATKADAKASIVEAQKKRKRSKKGDDSSDEEERGGKETTARNETEKRMYAAVRKAGKQIRSQGKMGQFGGAAGGSEYQVAGMAEIERMVSDKRR
jgi:ATP-dependent RNA helicase DDX31/DBP7